jgi:hypothetical protein
MIFEIGKFYKHRTGMMLSIVGRLNTTMFGDTLIAETDDNVNFQAVGSTEAYAENYREISEEEWMKNFNKIWGKDVLETETRPCSDCYFSVTKDNKVCYKIKNTTCFREIISGKEEGNDVLENKPDGFRRNMLIRLIESSLPVELVGVDINFSSNYLVDDFFADDVVTIKLRDKEDGLFRCYPLKKDEYEIVKILNNKMEDVNVK